MDKIIQSNGNYKLRADVVGEYTRSWDLKLATAEFAYNTTVNRTTGKSPHEIIYGFRPRQPIDRILVSDHIRASDSASSFVSHVNDLHKEVMDKNCSK